MTHNEILDNNKNYPVFKFCKENNIDCAWDYDNLYTWSEIYFNGERIFQFESITTVEQLIQTLQLFYNGTKPDEINNIVGGYDFFWSFGDELVCKNFIKQNAELFEICL